MELEIGADGHVVRARVADDALGDETVARASSKSTPPHGVPPPERDGDGSLSFRPVSGEPEQDD
ncbi:MAG: hypothetical protein R3B82_24835 [Sandaracinaceae bacterium]